MRAVYLILILIGIKTLFAFAIEHYFMTDDIYYSFLYDRYPLEKLDEIMNMKNESVFMGHIVMPIGLIIRILFVSMSIFAGTFFTNIPATFESIFKVVVKAEYVFLIPTILLMLWFGIFEPNYAFAEIKDFAPLSLISILNSGDLDPWIRYLYKVANLFEVLYVVAITYLLTASLNISFGKSFKIVLVSYGAFFLLLITTILFIIISFS